MLGIAGVFGVFLLLVFLQYYFDVQLDEIARGLLYLVLAWAVFSYSSADDGPRWARISLAGLLVALAILPFWEGYRRRSADEQEESEADNPLGFYLWLALILISGAFLLATH